MARHRNGTGRGGPAPDSNWKLNALTLDDLEDLSRIEHRCFRKPWSRQAIESVLSQRTYKAVGARTPLNKLVGYGIYLEVADELHILNVAVDPDHRRKGIGSSILNAIHQEAYANGRRQAFLEVRDSNSVAQFLYQKFGYFRLSKRLNYYEDENEDALLMRAHLKGTKS